MNRTVIGHFYDTIIRMRTDMHGRVVFLAYNFIHKNIPKSVK